MVQARGREREAGVVRIIRHEGGYNQRVCCVQRMRSMDEENKKEPGASWAVGERVDEDVPAA